MEEKYVEKEEIGRAEISIASFFAILKSKIILIVIITLLAAIVGGVFAYFNVPKYTASGSIMVNVKLDENKVPSYNDTILTEKYIPTVASFITEEVVIKRANEIYAEKGIDSSNISTSAISIEVTENNFIIDIKYTEKFNGEKTALIVKEKLTSLFEAIAEKTQERNASDPTTFKWFPISITINELQEYPSVSVSDAKIRIMIFAIVIGLVLSVIIALLIEYLDETVKSLDDVRKITNVNTVIGMEELQNRGKR
ncbi:MAG: hypothetical protein E7342_05110 [Clostridiales bacterium]|nr:hypothetical protein [Clostridiales bacterium]